MPWQLSGNGRSDWSTKLIRGLKAEAAAGFQSRRERCSEPTPATPQYAAFSTYKAVRVHHDCRRRRGILAPGGPRTMKAKGLGIVVVGSGRIGTLRARLAAKHPAVRFLTVSDKEIEQAKALADLTGADFYSTDNSEVIARPEVTAVFVSTPEGEHAAPVCKALELGKPVLVEKPLALSLNDAEAILK